jgi:hypothetical protein
MTDSQESKKGMTEMETVTLYRPNDLHSEWLSPSSAVWVEYVRDAFADEDNPCDICGSTIEAGYLCLDGGDMVCIDHVEIVPAWIGDKLAAEYAETIAAQNAMVGMRTHIGAAVLEVFARGSQHMPARYLGWVQPSDSALAAVGLDRASFEDGSRGTLPPLRHSEAASPYSR